MIQSLIGFIKGLKIQEASDPTKQLVLTVDSSATTGTTTTVVAAQTANRTVTLPDSNLDLNNVVTASSTNTFTNKTIDADGTGNSITNIENADIKAAAAIDATKIANGSVSNTEFQYLDGVTSNIQTQLNASLTNPMTTSGDTLYGGTSGVPTRLAGDTSNTRKFLREQSIAAVAQPPVWDTVQASDLVGTVAINQGGTGQTTANNALNVLLPNQATHGGEFLTTDGTNTSWASAGGGGGVTNWVTFTPTGNWTTNVVYDGYKRMVGDGAEVLYHISFTGATDATGLILDPPAGMTPDAGFIAVQGSSALPVGSYFNLASGSYTPLFAFYTTGFNIVYSTVDATSASVVEPVNANQVLANTAPYVTASGDSVIVKISYKV